MLPFGALIAGAAESTNSHRIHDLTNGFQGSVNVNHVTLLFVPQ